MAPALLGGNCTPLAAGQPIPHALPETCIRALSCSSGCHAYISQGHAVMLQLLLQLLLSSLVAPSRQARVVTAQLQLPIPSP